MRDCFGDAALSTGVKYPKSAYWYLQLLLGQKFDSPLVTKYRQWFPYYDMRKDEERGTILFQHDSETAYSPEELVAMILNYTRIIAQDYAEQPIRDCVITVPVFYTQAQRRAMLYAANLVGLNVLQLMTDAAATALNYGLFRQASFNATPQYIMFYDVGALSTTASIIEYRKAQVKEGSVANTYPQLSVKGVGYDHLLGGLEIDIRLRDHLARSFEGMKKTQGSVFESPRAMGKLLKEAKRVKRVLSANTDFYAQVEGLLEDVDFKLKVTREELEAMCSDLYDRVQEPVRQALEAADMTMVEMDSVILMGGGTRVPRFQEALLKAVNKPDLGRSLNTDEAAALGAVYQAAGQTKLFRVKKFIVKDANVLPIVVSFEKRVSGEGEEGEEEEEEVVKVVKKTLFQRSNAYPQKKVLTFNRYSKDFPFSVYYSHLGFLSDDEKTYVGRLNLSEVYLAGVGDALSTHSGAEAKGIKAHFRMDESGLLLLDYVESLFEYPPDEEEQSTFAKIGSTLSNLFGGGSSETETTEEPSSAATEEGEGEKAGTETEGEGEGVSEKEEEAGEGDQEEKVEEDDEGAVEEEDLHSDEGAKEEEEAVPVEEEEGEVPAGEETPESAAAAGNSEETETRDETPPTEETTPPTTDEGEEGDEKEAENDSETTPEPEGSQANDTASDAESTKKSKKKERRRFQPAGR
ncbi:Hypoxia up-regulated protein 1 (Fragment) [Geodia barretti]|uniref:Hypoxia up-regulated protein 1 n=1 Tax=Geodia barretti TaxID=519541 RepID=A0AA35WN83_GEOBA